MDIKRCQQIIDRFPEQSLLVVGDVMLDQYFLGATERISPEAPVPIVRVTAIDSRPGGAGNVALNLANLGCRTAVVGLIGQDGEGRTLAAELESAGIAVAGLVAAPARPTTVKTRIIARDQQVLRTDREDQSPAGADLLPALRRAIDDGLAAAGGVILADYNKGVLAPEIIDYVLGRAQETGQPVYVDPKHANFFRYRQVRLFKPNQAEFLTALNTALPDEERFRILGRELQQRLAAEIVLVTRGEQGMTLFHDETVESVATRARKVHDVSGAGDTVIAVFALADLAGATPSEAAELANSAAGRVCAEVGVVPVDQTMLRESCTGS